MARSEPAECFFAEGSRAVGGGGFCRERRFGYAGGRPGVPGPRLWQSLGRLWRQSSAGAERDPPIGGVGLE